MPRRKGQQSAEEQIAALKPRATQYVLTRDHMTQAELTNGLATSHFRCGCRKCHPEFWCTAINLNGHVCTMAGRKWEQAGDAVLCYRHMLEEVSRRNLEELRNAGA